MTVKELKTVELKMQTKTDKQEEKRIYLNQVRQHLSTLPMIGINAICYQPFGKEAQSMEVSEVLPEGYDKKITDNPFYQPTLQLTGMYLMQEARRKKEFVDRKKLQEMDEEFSSNLVKAKLVVAVVPPEGKEQEQQLDLKECKLPYLKHQSKGNFFPVFTDLWEFLKSTKIYDADTPNFSRIFGTISLASGSEKPIGFNIYALASSTQNFVTSANGT